MKFGLRFNTTSLVNSATVSVIVETVEDFGRTITTNKEVTPPYLETCKLSSTSPDITFTAE